MSPAVEARGLVRRYGSGADAFTAVHGLDLTVERGTLYALLGTNGAGKTSSLEVLEGLSRPTSGTARILGMDPWKERTEVRSRTGIVLQSGGFPHDLSSTETLRFWSRTLPQAMPIERALELVGLSHRADVRTSGLSGGERRRLDLAAALLGRPEVLFLDEPTTGLDPESRRNTWRLVEQVREAGTTVVLTTHYLEEAETLADRVGIMHEGHLVREGTVGELVTEAPAVITFVPRRPDGRVLPPPATPAESIDDDGRVEIRTQRLQEDLTGLLLWAREHDVALDGLKATAASLESIFLSIADDGATPVGVSATEPDAAPATTGGAA